ncbi:MAG TPA: ABC transporter ATP-binding protein [Acidimicrobiia bacterium]|nr:ABC transporter ATP-binding protein [Acidimicrobiia bacterium]
MSRPAPIVRLVRYARPHRGSLIAASTYSVLNKVMDLAPEILLGGAIDIVVRGEESFLSWFGVTDVRLQFVVLGVLTFVVWGLESLFEYLQSVGWRNLAQTVQHELRIDAYTHIQDLDVRYFEDRSTGGLMAVLNDDVNQLERFLDLGANDLIQTVTAVTGVGIVFFVLSPTVAVLSIIPIPLLIWGSVKFTRLMAPRYANVRDQAGGLSGLLANNLGGITTIKAFTAERRERARVEAESDAYRNINRHAIRLSSAFVPVIRIGILAGFLVTMLVGGFRALDGTLEPAAYTVLVFLTQRLLWPLTSLGQTLDLYQRSMASTNRILDVLDTETEMEDGGTPLPRPRADIRYTRVSFSYTDGHGVLDDVTFRVEPAQTVAIVGSTGSGKTTLVKLLLRFVDCQAGSITIDGHDVRDVTLESLRGSIGLVSQDVFLFHGTVAENIAYGRPDASPAEIESAAKAAEAHDFVMALPDGYESIVGERGQKLSGGQRQRISIARAILRDPAILILDEATSAVDNETEAAIQRSLRYVSENRTTLVIAHRLSTIRHADMIHVLERGRIVESGTHDQLVALDGIYGSLWKVQTGEALDGR